MATSLPPPKRQKVYHGIPEPTPEPPKPTPHVVVQFVSEEDGQPLAPAVNLPANVSREGLEILVNKLSAKVSSLGNHFMMKCVEIMITRTMTQCRLHSILRYLRTLLSLGHQRRLSYQNQSKTMYSRIRRMRSHPRTSS